MSKFRKNSGLGTSLSSMKLAKLTAVLSVSSLLFTALALVSLSTNRAEILSDPNLLDKPVVGLAIEYRENVAPLNISGKLSGTEPISSEIKSFADVGLGIWSVQFSEHKTESEARELATRLAVNPNIKSIYLDHLLIPATIKHSSPVLGGMKSSSAPTALRATDGWRSTAPQDPRVRLSWSAPTRLNGGVIWGYRISQFDSDSNTWKILLSNTQSTATAITVTSNLIAGTTTKLKVAAVTKSSNGKNMAVSPYSAVTSFKPTAAPKAPLLQSAGEITSASPLVSWQPQSTREKGGLATNYQVNAAAPDNSKLTCTTTSNSCVLSGMQSQTKYTVTVTATNQKGSATSVPVSETTDPMFGEQWYLTSEYGVNIQPAWKITKGSPSVVVAVLDTGITSHPDLNDNVVAGYDFILSDSNSRDGQPGRDADATDPGDYSTTKREDSSWHGTHVAGIIAASANSIGITGVAPNVKISPIRVLGVNGGSESDIAAGINWAIGVPISGVPTNKNIAKVINLSIGSNVFSNCGQFSPTQKAIDAAKARNVTIVTSAGNDDKYASESYPGNCFGNITIGATGYYGDRATYSNYSYLDETYGMYIGVDISAPGGDEQADIELPAEGGIWSTWNDGKTKAGNPTYSSEVGTSMASPIAAGVIALMYSLKPNITEEQVWEILRTTAKPFAPDTLCSDLQLTAQLRDGGDYLTGYCGAGIIDAGAAVTATKNLK